MPVALSRIKQLAIKIEAVEGVAEPLLAADFSRNVKDVTCTASLTRYARGILRSALTKLKDLLGGKIGEITWTEEMTGGSVSTEAPWYPTVQGAGMQKVTLKKITVTSPSGTFAAGDTITATGGKVGIIAWTGSVGGALKIVYEPTGSAFADTDSITSDAGSPATGTVSGAPANAGFRHKPMSENGSQTPPSATVEYRNALYTERLVGARGDFTLKGNWGEPLLLEARYRGPRQIKDVDGTPLDPGLMSGVTAAPAPSFIFGDIGFPLKIGTFAAVLSQFAVKLGNTLTDRKTISQSGPIGYVTQAYPCGYMPTRITDRATMFSIDPEAPAEATKSLKKNWQSNADDRVHVQCGLLLTAGQSAVCINGPKGSINSESWTENDRDGIVALALDMLLTGVTNNDDEVYLDHVYI